MSLNAIFANLSCLDIRASEDWFTHVFGRPPDARPMPGLVEWHHQGLAGLQLFQNPEAAGHGALTLLVDDVRLARERLTQAGLAAGLIEGADEAMLCRLRDPDGNLLVLAQPRG